MAVVLFTGFETGDVTETLAISGTGSIQSSVVRSGGSFAFRSNPTTTTFGSCSPQPYAATGTTTSITTNTDRYVRFYFRYATKPAANNEILCVVTSAAGRGATNLEVRINSSGNLLAYRSTTLLATGTTVLAADTWYRIEVKRLLGVTADWEVKIDGASEISGSANFGASTGGTVILGKSTDRNGNTVDFFYDDYTLSDSAYPGAGAVRIMQPDGNGTHTGWTASTGQKWQCVDDAPHNSDTDFVSTSTSGAAYSATLESAANAGVTGTVRAVKSIAVVRDEGGTSAFNVRLRSGSTDNDTTNFNSANSYNTISKLYTTDPATGAAWDLSALDSIEVGVEANAAVAHRCTMLCAMVEFDDTPAATGQPAAKRMGGVQFTQQRMQSSVGRMW